MIVVRLKGGLGNQLFQYAAGRALSLRLHRSLVFGTSFLTNTPRGTTKYPFGLAVYSIPLRMADQATSAFVERWSTKIAHAIPYHRRWKFVREVFHQDPNQTRSRKNILLDGYWQSDRYFTEFESTISKELALSVEIDTYTRNMLEQIEKSESISVHVRRGDYVTDLNAAKVHGLCTKEYYENASCYLNSRIKMPTFIVFSDDIKWARENLVFPGACIFVESDSTTAPWRDLYLMSKCKYNIIANSSYSWWGAWMNNHKDKIVIAPKRWFLYRDDQIVPDAWIRL